MVGESFKTLTNILTSPDLYQYERGKLSQLKHVLRNQFLRKKKIYAFNYVGVI